VSFAAIILRVASQRVSIVVSVYFVTDSVRKLLDTPSYITTVIFKLCFNIFCLQTEISMNTMSQMFRCTLQPTVFIEPEATVFWRHNPEDDLHRIHRSETLKGRSHTGILGIDGRTILKMGFKKQNMKTQ